MKHKKNIVKLLILKFFIRSLKSNCFLRKSFISKERDISFISGGDGNRLKLTHPKLIEITEKILRHLSNFGEEIKTFICLW